MSANEANPSRAGRQPFIYAVAADLHRFVDWPRDRQLEFWRRVLDLYHHAGRELPEDLKMLCQPAYVEDLLENEVFWGLAGKNVNRLSYAHATEFLPAVYAAAAWQAAVGDSLIPPGEPGSS